MDKTFHMSSTEYLNYENTKFSKSRFGVFGSDAKNQESADAWRFYILQPSGKMVLSLHGKIFKKKLIELIGNLGNLVNRTLTL